MMDRLMLDLHGLALAYHGLRGSGLSEWAALRGAVRVTYPRRRITKPVTEFQREMWRAVTEIARINHASERTERRR